MTDYADTNFFVALLVVTPHSTEADEIGSRLWDGRLNPLPVSRLIEMELVNALQRLLFEMRNGTMEVRITPENALTAESHFRSALAEGVQWKREEAEPGALMKVYDDLVHRHTARYGFRTYDIIHVASAITLGCDTFLSFDARAKKLAVLEGLKTN